MKSKQCTTGKPSHSHHAASPAGISLFPALLVPVSVSGLIILPL